MFLFCRIKTIHGAVRCGAVRKSTNGVDIEYLGRTDSAHRFSGLLKYDFLVNVHVK